MKSKMYTLFTLLASLAICLGFTTPDATGWKIDKNHSAINFTIKHFFTPVTGAFNDYEATINFDPEKPEEGNIDIKILVNSVDTKNDRRDGHLQTKDFFDAETWPYITFTSDKITSSGKNEYIAHGTLTIKDVSKKIDLPFTLLGIKNHPRKENAQIAGITSSTTIDRSEFGVGTGDWASDAVVSDDITISLALELNSLN